MNDERSPGGRLRFLRYGFALAGIVIVGQLFRIQVLSNGFYEALASGQQGIFQELFPERGKIYSRDTVTGEEYVLATNQKLTLVFAEPFRIEDPEDAVQRLAPIFGWEEDDQARFGEKLSDSRKRYVPLQSRVPDDMRRKIEALDIKGIRFTNESFRFYPEKTSGAQVIGFVGAAKDSGRSGQYGIEGYFNEELSGSTGFVESERDSSGRILVTGKYSMNRAVDGSDIVLTLDRTIQYVICGKLQAWIEANQAERGSVIVLDPKTGAIRAMCNAPVFDPNEYNMVESIGVYNNTAVFAPYEPGSVFKAIGMAAGLDTAKITPDTEFDDTGEVKIGPYTIRNSDMKSNGVVTMTDVIVKSLNTGMVEVASRLGPETFLKYVKDFGFGKRTGVELHTEMPGTIDSLSKRGVIWSATGSFGQGITVTLLQLVSAYGAIANDGVLMKPYIVDEMRSGKKEVEIRSPKKVRRVISERASKLLTGMLVSVVERGHGKRAAVPGYWIAGKTGTAQIARSDVAGYEKEDTIGSFIGFGPIDDPRFVIGVRIDRPQTVRFAESAAAPLFGEIAQFLVDYYKIPPSRR